METVRCTILHVTNQTGNAPACHACYLGHARCVEILLSHGANVDVTNLNKVTLVHTAARAGHVDCLELLSRSGAKMNQKDVGGSTALDASYQFNETDVVRLLESLRCVRS
eukprot:655389-Rhodomonas_salina.2